MRPEEPPVASENEQPQPAPSDVQESPPPFEPDLDLIAYREKGRNSDTD